MSSRITCTSPEASAVGLWDYVNGKWDRTGDYVTKGEPVMRTGETAGSFVRILTRFGVFWLSKLNVTDDEEKET